VKVHEMKYRVCYGDTDQMGVVYYANYLVFFERSRTEFLRDAGLPYSEIEASGVRLPVTEAHCEYKAPANYDDLLTFKSWTEYIKGARLKLVSEVWREDTLLCRGYVVLVCVNETGRPIRPPKNLIEACS
jgi:acyl-CoA thioester hydrolase